MELTSEVVCFWEEHVHACSCYVMLMSMSHCRQSTYVILESYSRSRRMSVHQDSAWNLLGLVSGDSLEIQWCFPTIEARTLNEVHCLGSRMLKSEGDMVGASQNHLFELEPSWIGRRQQVCVRCALDVDRAPASTLISRI